MGKPRNGASGITCLNVKKEYQDIFETHIVAMLEKAGKSPGHICSMVIPPSAHGGNYQVIQKFSTQQHLQTWQASKENTRWQAKLQQWCESENSSRHSTNTTGVFTTQEEPPRVRGAYKARLALVSWLGIYPTVSVYLWFGSPFLEGLPFLLRIAILTALIVPTMSYVVMPRLMRWSSRWLYKPG